MAEPVSSSTATATLAGVALLSVLPGVDAARVLGAFAGAVVFVLASQDLGLLRKAAFFLVAFIGGLLGAELAAGLVSSILPSRLEVSSGVGALLAAALVVKLLLGLIDKLTVGALTGLLRIGGRREPD
ncbi:putative holin [Roseateles flavus]|uniref:Holin n=1 Tax=Roseateles flavus TaxID=3149041 RepID=A0ABV0GG07_9BURK